ncbi:hypothetical protein [Saliterribacillus persicus]|uniref:Oligosaccharide repeat unit polymerase n=1 Tax=Saliterribacillus persicus TaxID=930114 RepID=A0A368YCH0_9BACI|nr:hypothetical protein [Saliterribacillus persicus]RCW77369.1 hypothetical protein DFR57_101241 [Saliterribacillus persicus]
MVSGINSLILDWSKLVLPLLLASIFIKKYNRKPIALYFYAIIFIVLFFNLMIFTGISRNSAIIPGAASLFFIIKIFPHKKKETFALVSILILFVTISLTIFKNTYLGTNETYTFSTFTSYLESYFVGPKNLGYAYKAKELYANNFNLNTFFNDVFANAPMISGFFDLENRTSTLYNITVYNGGLSRDAIIPTIGQGLFYTGYTLSILPELLIVWLMTKCDQKYTEATDIITAFFMSYFAVRFGFNFSQNFSIFSGFVFSSVVPLYILLYLNRKTRITLKRKDIK